CAGCAVLRSGAGGTWWYDDRRQQRLQMVREIHGDAAVAVAERLDPDPHDFTRGGDRIEIPGVVDVDARREDLGFEDRRGQGRPLQLLDRVEQRVGAAPPF